jgi:hypothetical protein
MLSLQYIIHISETLRLLSTAQMYMFYCCWNADGSLMLLNNINGLDLKREEKRSFVNKY